MSEEKVSLAGLQWHEVFPFVCDFQQVVDKSVSVDYVEQIACVLEPMVAVLSGMIEEGDVTRDTVGALFFSVNALARCRVALAYRLEIVSEHVDLLSLLEALVYEWECMEKRECLVAVGYTAAIEFMLGASVCTVWVPAAMQAMFTAGDLCRRYPSFVADVRVVPIAQVLVVSDKGTSLRELPDEYRDYPVIPLEIYRLMWQRLKGLDLRQEIMKPPDVLLGDRVGRLDIGYGFLETPKLYAWFWLLLASLGDMQGYCYQLLYPPAHRYTACLVLRQRPLVSEVLWHLDAVGSEWSEVFACIEPGPMLHVRTPGRADVNWLRGYEACRVGMQQAIPCETLEVDYYARALVDEFISKHKPLPTIPDAPPPLDAEFDMLSISTGSSAGREFVDVAAMLYSAIDEGVSPRAEAGEIGRMGVSVSDEKLVERDSEIVQEIYSRLTGGAVVHESYFQRTYNRFLRLHRRPRLDKSDGRMYHVFEGFLAESGVGVGPWEIDKNWGIPGWRSYVAQFEPGETRTVSFTVDGGCQDVRMDCSGEGAIELGDCKVRVEGTLLWFTNSIRLRLVAKTGVTLRISVPDALGAVAIGAEMRRYMYIPGFAVVARSYDVVTGSVDFSVPMERVKRNSVAGCHGYSGQRYIERGRHRFKLGQIASLAPARILFKTDPPDALEHVSVCGMRLHPRTRDYVSVLVDLRNVEMYVSSATGAVLLVSMVQVVRIKEYELAVVSTIEAKAARATR